MPDRIFLRIVLVILAVLAALSMRTAFAETPKQLEPQRVEAGMLPGDYCNARGYRTPWTPEAKAQTRARVQAVTSELGVSRAVAAYHQAILWRESFGGEASVRHTLGEDVRGQEDGLGPYGLSLRWHRDKWPGENEDPAFCSPEVSAVVAHEIMWRAVTRHGASTLLEVQAVYAGAVTRRGGVSVFTLSPRARQGIRARMRKQGFSADAPITERDLGRRLGELERREFAVELAGRWIAAHRGR